MAVEGKGRSGLSGLEGETTLVSCVGNVLEEKGGGDSGLGG